MLTGIPGCCTATTTSWVAVIGGTATTNSWVAVIVGFDSSTIVVAGIDTIVTPTAVDRRSSVADRRGAIAADYFTSISCSYLTSLFVLL